MYMTNDYVYSTYVHSQIVCSTGKFDPRTIISIVIFSVTVAVCVAVMGLGWFSHLLPKLKLKMGHVSRAVIDGGECYGGNYVISLMWIEHWNCLVAIKVPYLYHKINYDTFMHISSNKRHPRINVAPMSTTNKLNAALK